MPDAQAAELSFGLGLHFLVGVRLHKLGEGVQVPHHAGRGAVHQFLGVHILDIVVPDQIHHFDQHLHIFIRLVRRRTQRGGAENEQQG